MLDGIPSQLVAGDTWKWRTPATCDYSAADGWELATSFRGAGSLDVTGAANGDDWDSIAAAVDTTALAAGRYSWQARVSLNGEVFTLASGIVEVVAALVDQTDPYDGRTQAEKLLAAADAAYLSIIGGKAAAQFGDQQFTEHNLATLGKIRDGLRNEVAAEKARANGGKGRRILVNFARL